MENNGIWEYRFKVRSFDVDQNNFITTTSISEYLQEVAGDHSNNMGFGYRQFVLKNMAWILSGIRIEIERLPKWEEEVLIKSWVVENDKFISRRDFSWYDKDGNTLLSASTKWILFDTNIRRPQIVDRMGITVEMHPDKKATNEVANIRNKITEGSIVDYTVQYSDLDMVGHMNNTKYIQLLLNSYSPEFHKTNKLKTIDINFKTEAQFNDKLHLHTNIIENKKYYHELKRATDNKINCSSIILWE